MEDVAIAVIRDLPSTAVLILFVWFTSKQFQQAITLISEHLKEINKILEICMKSANLSEKEKDIDRKLHTFARVVEELNISVKQKRDDQ